MQEHAGTHRDRYKHFGNAHLQKLLYSPLFVVFRFIFFDSYFDFIFLFLLRVSNRIQEFQVEILFEHFLTATSTCDATATTTTTAESASVLLLAAKLRKLLHCFKSYLECLVYLRAPQLNASIKTSFQHAENAISILISFQVGF